MKNLGFILVGHLQVLNEPLSSLYMDRNTEKYYIFVRSYSHPNSKTYVVSSVKPLDVVAYLDKKKGLKAIFSSNENFEYQHKNGSELTLANMFPILQTQSKELLQKDILGDLFDDSLAFKSVALRNYMFNKYLKNK